MSEVVNDDWGGLDPETASKFFWADRQQYANEVAREWKAKALEEKAKRLEVEAETERLKAETECLKAETERLEAEAKRLESETKLLESENHVATLSVQFIETILRLRFAVDSSLLHNKLLVSTTEDLAEMIEYSQSCESFEDFLRRFKLN